MFRWWNEVRDPALKCERVGHQVATRRRSGMVSPENYRRHVADLVEQERKWCPRCGLALNDWSEVSRSGISSWSAPSEVMRKFEKAGEYWHEH